MNSRFSMPCSTTPNADNLLQLRNRLIDAAEGLYREARSMSDSLRLRQTDLADRFFQQSRQLDQVIARLGTTIPAPAMPIPKLIAPAIAKLAIPPQPGLDARQSIALRSPRSLDDISGASALRQQLKARFVYPLRDPLRARRYGQRAGGGMLLFGPPGTGKTLIARTLAAELDIPVFSISPSQIISKWLGDSERQLAEVFDKARQHPASLIFVHEIDALAPNRDSTDNNSAMQRLLAQLLTELDGFSEKPGHLLFLGATNRPWDVDAALLRTGRFDTLAYVGLPDRATRTELLRETLAPIPLSPEVDCAVIARQLSGYSAAETVAVAKAAACLAFSDSAKNNRDRPVDMQDLEMALRQIHRATTPGMLLQFRSFAEAHGLPTPEVEEADDGTEQSHPSIPVNNGVAPFCQVSARELKAEIELQPFVSYALQHAGINPVRKLRITNNGKEESQNLLVEVALVPDDFGEAWTENIAELAVGAHWTSTNISLPLRLDRLRQVQEKEVAHVRVTIRDKDEVLFATTRELPVLAYNEWLFLPDFLELSSAFVQSNAPALNEVMLAATMHLEKATGQRSFSGYQSNDPRYVLQMLQAIHNALRLDIRLSYINPPPSFELTGQKIRLVAETLAQKRGTCLDLAILQAALWEHVGLYPCLVLVPGHAFLGCWMQPPEAQRNPVASLGAGDKDALCLQKALSSGDLQLFNSVEVALDQSLADAQEHGRAIVREVLASGKNVHVIDIAAG